VDAAALPELLARETASALLEVAGAEAVVLRTTGSGEPKLLAWAGCGADTARALARGADEGGSRLLVEPLGREPDGEREVVLAIGRPIGPLVERRMRMLLAVARQGFELCEARERPTRARDTLAIERPLEPLIPGFL